MADNLNVTEGSGKVIASDDIGGVHYPKEKVCFGADGSATMVAATAGSALPIEGVSGGTAVAVSAASLPLPSGAATAAKQPALGTAGTPSTDVLSVQGITSGVAIKTDGSAVTQPVSIAAAVAVTDNSGSLTVDDGGSSLTVDGTVAFSNTTIAVTNAGTFAVQAAQSGTWNITNISGTVSLPTGAATAAKQPALGTAGTASSDVLTVQGIASMTALKVDGSAVTQPVSVASAIAVTDNSGSLTVDNNGTFAVQATLQAGTNGIGKLTANSGVTIGAVEIAATQTLATVTTVGTVSTITNVVHVDDNSGSLTVDGTVTANLAPTTSGGCTMSSTLSSASSNTATSVKGSAGQLYGIYVSNTNASARWLKFYNTASTPTAGSGTPVLRLLIPGNTSGVAGAFEFSNGVAFSSGIGFTITGAVADNDTTAISANEVIVNVLYK